jgi:spore coat polysaccharide biosynthesis predicted glycosyltransferase SpsG
MRSLAVADAWTERTGSSATFLMANSIPALETHLQDHGHDILPVQADPGTDEDLQALRDRLTEGEAGPVLVDGYHIGPEYLEALHPHADPLAYLDDTLHLDRYPVDFLVNPSGHLTPDDVPGPDSDRRLLFGPDHVLLRDEFRPYRDWTRDHPDEDPRLLVTLGGLDPDGVLPQVLDELVDHLLTDLEVLVVTRETNPHLEAVRDALTRYPGEASLALDVDDMARRMETTDLAVSAGGVTAWELAYMQVPTSLIRVADNQVQVGRTLSGAGAAVDLGHWPEVSDGALSKHVGALAASRDRRARMGTAGRRLVDGRGADRLVEALGA